MYRRRRERRQRLLQKFTIWFPMIILAVMFLLGACTGRSAAAQGRAGLVSTAAAVRTETDTAPAVHSPEEGLRGSLPGDSVSASAETSERESPEEILTDEAAYREALTEGGTSDAGVTVTETGNYTSKEEVALYLHLYGRLPSNYITKREAEERGWDAQEGNLSDVLPGRSIGGSPFGNYEGLLPKADGRKYYECDIDYDGGYRNAKRIIYSNDGLIFYTEDHYEHFEQLY